MTDRTYINATALKEVPKLLFDINALEMRANELHLFPCARALNNAKNAAGWQIAGNIERAAEAVTHKD